jgi:hypothetical protein
MSVCSEGHTEILFCGSKSISNQPLASIFAFDDLKSNLTFLSEEETERFRIGRKVEIPKCNYFGKRRKGGW